jgi:hypothetical protein
MTTSTPAPEPTPELNVTFTQAAKADLEKQLIRLEAELAEWKTRVEELDQEAQEYYDEIARTYWPRVAPLATPLLIGFIIGLILGLFI